MTDIVERLRDNLNFHMEAQSIMHEAADEIERLRHDNERLNALWQRLDGPFKLEDLEEIFSLRDRVVELKDTLREITEMSDLDHARGEARAAAVAVLEGK